MIRIDEIYNNTFWPWVKKHIPLTRVFFCDPPGRSDVDSLFNYGQDLTELHYIFFHDQEPIHLDIHKPLFDEIVNRNQDLDFDRGGFGKALITSEWNSEFVDALVSTYDWKHYYYFFHGWASLDWFRGYNQTFLMPEPEERTITHGFISPNRIIGGRRDHRVLMMYHMIKLGIENSWISCPRVCPVEGQDIADISAKWINHYPDIADTFNQSSLPLCFPGETDHPMHSCWLSLFDESACSLAYVINETVYFGKRNHLTEKTFKPICLKMPFVMASSAGSLKYLRSYGFKTFGDFWDESYDDETDDIKRMEMIANLLKKLDAMPQDEKQKLFDSMRDIVEHNHRHFYNGAFEKILWEELTSMLGKIKNDFRIRSNN
jgi:hypothetical protein